MSEWRSGNNPYDTQYTYDNFGNRSTKVDSSGTTTYTYDVANELTTETDPSSNITTYSYDNNGNLTTQNAVGSVTTHAWDYENRLHTVTLPSDAITTFAYDGDGLRRQSQTSAATTFARDIGVLNTGYVRRPSTGLVGLALRNAVRRIRRIVCLIVTISTVIRPTRAEISAMHDA